MKNCNILIVGVGGQGVILASEILSEVGIKAGFDVKKSEIHGMSQRGGSVSSDIRFDKEKVYSPIIPRKKADFIVGFEKLETLRAIDRVKDDGIIISSNYRLDPMTVSAGNLNYPKDVEKIVAGAHAKTHFFNHEKTVEIIGNPKAMNIFILGALASFMGLERSIWEEIIKKRVPPHTVDLNLNAFAQGWKIGGE